MQTGNIDPHKYSGPLEDIEKGKAPEKKPGAQIAVAIAVLIVLMAGGLIVFLASSEGGEIFDFDNGVSDSDANIIPFIPIWIAVFIPLAFANKKIRKSTSVNKNFVALIAVGIIAFVMFTLGLVVFLVVK